MAEKVLQFTNIKLPSEINNDILLINQNEDAVAEIVNQINEFNIENKEVDENETLFEIKVAGSFDEFQHMDPITVNEVNINCMKFRNQQVYDIKNDTTYYYNDIGEMIGAEMHNLPLFTFEYNIDMMINENKVLKGNLETLFGKDTKSHIYQNTMKKVMDIIDKIQNHEHKFKILNVILPYCTLKNKSHLFDELKKREYYITPIDGEGSFAKFYPRAMINLIKKHYQNSNIMRYIMTHECMIDSDTFIWCIYTLLSECNFPLIDDLIIYLRNSNPKYDIIKEYIYKNISSKNMLWYMLNPRFDTATAVPYHPINKKQITDILDDWIKVGKLDDIKETMSSIIENIDCEAELYIRANIYYYEILIDYFHKYMDMEKMLSIILDIEQRDVAINIISKGYLSRTKVEKVTDDYVKKQIEKIKNVRDLMISNARM